MKLNIAGHRTADNAALRAATLALCALSLVACGDDDVGAPVIMIDAGTDMNTAVDMFVPRDMPPACAPANITPLPAAALPRCAAATQDAVVACGPPASMAALQCVQRAIDADTTTPLMSGGQTLDCAGCFNLQQIACFYTSGCNAQIDAFFCCVEAEGCTNPNACPACSTQQTAFSTCALAQDDCFDATMGEIDGCFGEPTPPSDGGTPVDGGDADGGTETDAGTDGGTETDAGTDAGTTTTP